MGNGYAFIRLPDGSLRVGLGPFEESASPVDGPCFYVNNWRLTDPAPWKVPASIEKTTDLTEILEGSEGSLNAEWRPPNLDEFSPAFQQVASLIGQEGVRKMVPVVTERGEFDQQQAGRRLAARIAGAKEPLVPYGYSAGASGFVGATPEFLFSRSGSELTTMALAGTAPTAKRAAFEKDPKEIREHEMVVEHIVARLTDFGAVERLPREIFDLEGLCHFCSKIRAKIPMDLPLKDLIVSLHPTPAVGTLPATAELRQVLLNIRNVLGAPDWFGAPFGYAERDTFHCVVAIRGIGWDGCQAGIPSGCGIVGGSDLTREWDELALKRESVKKLFSL